MVEWHASCKFPPNNETRYSVGFRPARPKKALVGSVPGAASVGTFQMQGGSFAERNDRGDLRNENLFYEATGEIRSSPAELRTLRNLWRHGTVGSWANKRKAPWWRSDPQR